MTIGDWEQVPDGKMPTSELTFNDPNDFKDPNDLLGPSPPYEEAIRSTRRPDGPSRLRIFGATWGGIDVTAEIQGMVTLDRSDKFETVTLNMHTIHTALLPDPAVNVIKTLTVLYQYDDDQDPEMRLLNATQFAPQINVCITPTAHLEKAECFPSFFTSLNGATWRDADGQVEIIAVLYGTERIQTPSVLDELAQFFKGRRGQIRTTSSFFRTDPWLGVSKSWTVYFRLLNSATPTRVRCVTGMQDGALEVPWTRD
ncbi:hypothetical protein VTI74DRAFT_10715 [Chaetomium olivicolor]